MEASPETSTTSRQLVVFYLADEEYALPIGSVQEIIHYSEPRSVASRDESVLGVINLRGNIVPVYDIKPRLGLQAELDPHAKIVVVEHDGGVSGIVVDEVAEVLTVEVGEYEDVPAGTVEFVEGVVKHDTRLLVLLDPGLLFGAVPAEA